jgi:hypothetical protein
VYAEGKKFVSFKKALRTLESKAELFSFHSVSKVMLSCLRDRGCPHFTKKVSLSERRRAESLR